ncbi:PAS domain S-box protein, partial [Oleiphilus sp. HI0117]
MGSGQQKHIESDRMLKAITDQSSEGITVADTEGNYVFVNPAFCKMSGYSKDELLGMTVFDIKAPEQDHRSFERTKTTEEGLTVEVLLQRKDGSTYHSEVVGKNIDIDGKALVLGIVRDISQEVKTGQKIRTLSQAVEQSPVSVMIIATNGSIKYVNQAFETTSGYPLSEVEGKKFFSLMPDHAKKDTYAALFEALEKEHSWEGEVQIRKKNGETFWEYGHISPVKDEYGKVIHYLAVKEDISTRKAQEEKIFHQAHFDSLTDLPNRLLSLDRLTHIIGEAQRQNNKVALLFVDLDDFKKVNDSLGHDMGDEVLMVAAERLSEVLRTGDTVGRLGGDEFILILGGLDDEKSAQKTAERILEQFRSSFDIEGRKLMLTASIGIALFPHDGATPTDLLRNADSAMYHAKSLGRNAYSFYTEEMNQQVARRLQLEEQIHGALDRNEFSLAYQPQVDVQTDKIIGAEALLRWNNQTLGQVPPDEFIPIAEETGLIIPIGQFVLHQALSQASKWQKQYQADFRMAVNLSPRQFRDPDLISQVERIIQDHQVARHTLEFEITEGVLMNNQQFVKDALRAL